MKSSLVPYLSRKIHGIHVLWFKNSNKYLLLNTINYSLLSSFIKSKDDSEFHVLIHAFETFPKPLSEKLYVEFDQLLKSLNEIPLSTVSFEKIAPSENSFISVCYKFKNVAIKVCYQSVLEKNIIHPQFSHLEDTSADLKVQETFYIKNSNQNLHLYKGETQLGTYKQMEYHLLQGKFAMELLCLLTNTQETDWLGTFHASTIANTIEAIMLVGESGKGKSTLATILMANGFNLVADDFTPMLAKSKKIYHYPSAISIKNGSFNLLESLSDKVTFNNSVTHIKKGELKYVVPINPIAEPVSCKKMVLVEYNPQAKTSLQEIPAEEILPILIPDSWISPEPENAKHFLDWLETCTFYKLTYHDSQEAVNEINQILED